MRGGGGVRGGKRESEGKSERARERASERERERERKRVREKERERERKRDLNKAAKKVGDFEDKFQDEEDHNKRSIVRQDYQRWLQLRHVQSAYEEEEEEEDTYHMALCVKTINDGSSLDRSSLHMTGMHPPPHMTCKYRV